jgi:hypothetical protein
MLVALRSGMLVLMGSVLIAIGVFGLRRVVGMGLVFEGVLLVGMDVMRVPFARIGRRIRRGRDRCLDGCRNRLLGLRFRGGRLCRDRAVIVLIVVLAMFMRMVVNMLVRMILRMFV